MSLICPLCDADRFRILDCVELGRDQSWDEQTLQRACCPDCNTRFVCAYREKRSFRSDRDDKVSHMAFQARKFPWWLAGLIFEKSPGRRSSSWRITRGQALFDKCRGTNPPLPVVYQSANSEHHYFVSPLPTYPEDDILTIGNGLLIKSLGTQRALTAALKKLSAAFDAHPDEISLKEISEAEEFEFAVDLLRYMSAYDDPLRDDLLIHSQNSISISLGALLSLICPGTHDSYIYSVSDKMDKQGSWLLSLAIRTVEGKALDADTEIVTLINTISSKLADIEFPKAEIWKISDIPQEEFDQFQEKFKDMYRRSGSEAALKFLNEAKLSDEPVGLSEYLRYRFAD